MRVRRYIVLFVVSMFLSVFVMTAAGALTWTTYFAGNTTNNHWQLSGSAAKRWSHSMSIDPFDPSLPAHAQLQVANFSYPDKVMINSRRSEFGARELHVDLTSNNQWAYAGCRIIAQGPGGVITRYVYCRSQWGTP